MPLELYSVNNKKYFRDEFENFLRNYNVNREDINYNSIPKIINNGRKGFEYRGKIPGLEIEIKKRILFA